MEGLSGDRVRVQSAAQPLAGSMIPVGPSLNRPGEHWCPGGPGVGGLPGLGVGGPFPALLPPHPEHQALLFAFSTYLPPAGLRG